MTLPAENVAPQLTRNRRLIIVIGVVFPLLITMAAAFVMALWVPELPNPVASHWGTSGPDGYSTVGSVIALPLLLTLVFAALAAFASWKGGPQGGMLWVHKIMVATSVFMSLSLSIIAAGSLAVQRGLDNAENAPDIGGIALAAFPIALVVAGLAWLMLPPSEQITSTSVTAKPLEGATTQRVHFSSGTRVGAGVVVIVTVALVALGVALGVQAVSNPAELLLPAVIGLVVMALAVSTLSWRVTIDHRGLRVRSAFGFPRASIAPDQIASVGVVEVNPIGEFGGYGWRWAPGGRSGIVLAAGEALEVTRTNGKQFIVTMHDAQRAAEALATVAKK
ncbi:DUF1648 domain-containing protein [Salinibacterium sp. UTAS2018]|uniref:DUF1648 domain-containing protein n=1 Tax=unclassified Salinibacterium TaxID=2632331 RepID=UPI0010093F35|nr:MULTISPECIES: DUF1648 domain-containing protein [unclassified Salinibacterium]MBH0009075.1 DUF1648 domain-containing protein [Salinibacterium sp. SWN1162]QAV69689.1 DUF1648 domain-containing protein [Salinibacterium sp. UTAS2018]